MPQLNKRMVRTFDDLDISWLRTQIMTSELLTGDQTLGDQNSETNAPLTEEIDNYIDHLQAQEIQKRKKIIKPSNNDFT